LVMVELASPVELCKGMVVGRRLGKLDIVAWPTDMRLTGGRQFPAGRRGGGNGQW
jgi:hypothetical protein